MKLIEFRPAISTLIIVRHGGRLRICSPSVGEKQVMNPRIVETQPDYRLYLMAYAQFSTTVMEFGCSGPPKVKSESCGICTSG